MFNILFLFLFLCSLFLLPILNKFDNCLAFLYSSFFSLGIITPFSFVSKLKLNLLLKNLLSSQVKGGFTFLELSLSGTIGLLNKFCSFRDSHEVLLSFKKWGVTLNNSSFSIILLSFLFKHKILFSSFLILFFSRLISGEFDGVFWDSLDPLVEGSKSSLELSGIIILRIFFLCWVLFSMLSSIVSSFISLISLIFEGTNFIVFAGLYIIGWSFWEDLLCPWTWLLSGAKSPKKSFGKPFLLVLMLVKLYI